MANPMRRTKINRKANGLPVLKTGIAAFYDTMRSGLVPVKVLEVKAPAKPPTFDLRSGLAPVSIKVKALVTKDQGAYYKGMIIDTDSTKVPPKAAIKRGQHSTTIRLYTVQPDTAHNPPKSCRTNPPAKRKAKSETPHVPGFWESLYHETHAQWAAEDEELRELKRAAKRGARCEELLHETAGKHNETVRLYRDLADRHNALFAAAKRVKTNPPSKFPTPASVASLLAATTVRGGASERDIHIGPLVAFWGTDGDYDLAAGVDAAGEPKGFYLGVTVLAADPSKTVPPSYLTSVLRSLASKLGTSVLHHTLEVEVNAGEAGAIVKEKRTVKVKRRK